VAIDVGTSTGTTGVVQIGINNASAITLGRTGITVTNPGSESITQNLTVSGTVNTNTFTSSTLTFGNNAAAGNIDAGSGQTLNLGTSATAHNTVLGSTGGASNTTINAGGSIILGSATIQRSASSLTLDITNAGTSTLTVTNSNGANKANISVSGGVTIGSSQVYAVGASNGIGLTCSSGNVIQNGVVTGGIITGGTCIANGGGVTTTLATAYTNGTGAGDQTIALSAADGGGVLIKDASTTVGNLFTVQNNGGTSTYLNVTNAGISSEIGLTLGKAGPSGTDGQITFNNATNSNGLILKAGATGSAGLTFVLPTADGISGNCLSTDGLGNLAFSNCSGSGGGGAGNANRQLSNLSGVSINASLTPSTTNSIDLGSASKVWQNLYIGNVTTASTTDLLLTPTTGLVKLNTVSQNNEIQVYENAVSPTNYTSIKYGTIATNSGNLTLNAAGGTVILGANTTTLQKVGTAFSFDLNNASNSTFTVTNSGAGVASLSVEGGLTIGSGQAITVGATAGLTVDCSAGGQILSGIKTAGGVVTSGSCAANGSTPDLQTVYGASSDSSVTPQLTLNTTKHGLFIQDASSPLGSILFAVQSNGGANKYISVTSNGVDVAGNITATGTYNTNTFNNNTLTFGGASAASVDANGSQNLNVGTANNGHTTTIGSTNASSSTTIQGGSVINLVGAVNVNGTNTFTVNGGLTSLGANVDITGVLSLKHMTDVATTGNLNNLSVTSSLLRLSSATTPQTLTGVLVSGGNRDGSLLTVVNAGTNAATINDNDTVNSTAANAIRTGTNGAITLPINGSITMIYDSQATRWRVIGDVAGGTGGGVTTIGTYTNCTSYSNGAQISSGTLSLSCASISNPGLVDTGAQTFGGAKTFNSLLTGSAGLTVTGGAVSLTGNAASTFTTAAVGAGTSGTVTIGTGGGTAANSGSITIKSGNITTSGTAGDITIDTGSGSTAGTPTVHLGDANAKAVAIGNTGSSFTAESNATANLFNGATAHTINLGTGGALQAITIGSTNTTSNVKIQSGTGNSLNIESQGTISIGNNAVAQNITIGNGTGATSVAIQCGSASCGLGTNAVDHSTTVGSTTGTSLTTVQGGTGGVAIQAASTGTIVIGNTNNNNITLGGASSTTTSTGNFVASKDVDITGSLATKKGADYATTGTQADINFGDVSLVRLTGASGQTIAGIQNGRDGYRLTIINAGTTNAQINDNDTTNELTANRRIRTGTGGNISVAVNSSIELIYDSTAGFWRVVGDVAGGAGAGVTTIGTYTHCTSIANGAQISGNTLTLGCADASNPGLVDTQAQTFAGAKTFSGLITGNAGITTSGGAVTLQGNAASQLTTSTGDLTLDATAASANVFVGTGAQAKTIQIGTTAINTGNTQAINIGTTNVAGTTNVTIGSNSGATAGSTTIQSKGTLALGNAISGTINVQAATGGSITIGDNAVNNSVQIGTTAINTGNTQTIGIGNTNAAGTTNVTIGSNTGATAGTTTVQSKGTLSLGNAISSTINVQSAATGNINIGNNAVANTVQIGINGINTGNTQTINIGNQAAAGTTNVVIGSTTGATAGSTTIQSVGNLLLGNSVSSAISVQGASGATVSVGTTNNNVVSIGNTGGSFTAESNATANLFNGATAHTVNLAAGSGANNTTVNIGSGVTGGANTSAVTIGSINAAGSSTIIQGGNGAGAISLQAASSGTILLGTTNANSVDIGGSLALKKGTDFAGTGAQNNVAFGSNASLIRLTGVSAANISGIANGRDGFLLTLVNTSGSVTHTLLNDSGLSSVGNKIYTGTGATLNLLPNATVQMVYDSTAQHWQVIGVSSAGGPATTLATAYTNGALSTDQTILLSSGDGGGIVIKDNATSVGNALQIQNSSAAALFTADTQNMQVIVGNNGVPLAFQTDATAIPTAVDGSGFAYANGYVYLAGGFNTASTRITTVQMGKVKSDGTITWTTLSSTPLPAAIANQGSVIANGYLYELGGAITGPVAQATAYYAKINPDGTLGNWNTTTPLPAARYQTSAVLANGYIYMSGSNTVDGSTIYAKVNGDGTLGAWSTGSAMNTTTSGVKDNYMVTANNFVYSFGGFNSSNVRQTVSQYASINPVTGAMGAWTSTTAYSATAYGMVRPTIANGYVYVMGGENATPAVTRDISYAAINTDGTLGAFTTVTNALPGARAYGASFSANGNIYYLSGSSTNLDTNAQTTTYYASTTGRLKLNGSLDLVSGSGGTLADAGSGGSITAGNIQAVGTLQVQGAASFAQGISIGGATSIAGPLYVSGSLPTAPIYTTTTNLSGIGDVYVQGRYAYVTSFSNGKLMIYDVTNPASATLVNGTGTALSGFTTSSGGISVQGHYAYIISFNNNLLDVYDVANPNSPTLVSSVSTVTQPFGMTVSGRYAYLTGYNSGKLQIFDVSNPASPVSVSSTSTTNANPCAVRVQGNYAYVTVGGAGTAFMQIFNISNPASPTSVSNTSVGAGSACTAGNANNSAMFVQGRYAYYPFQSVGQVKVYDISNPASPSVAATISTGTEPNGVFVQNRYLYVTARSSNRVEVYDISNMASVASLGTISTGSTTSSLFVQGRYLYVGVPGSSTFDIFDLGGEYAQQLEAGGAELGTLGVDGNSMFAGDVNIQGGTTIGQSLQVNGNVGVNGQLYVSGTVPGSSLGTITTNLNTPTSVTVNGRYAYVTSTGNNTLAIYDVSSPASPLAEGTITTNLNQPVSAVVQGHYAYVASFGNNGLAIFDVANPASPTAVSLTTTGLSSPRSVYVSGRYAYIASAGNSSLVIFDISNPASPVQIGTISTNLNGPRSVFVQGNYAYVASATNNTLAIFNISNPAVPVAMDTDTTNLSSPFSVYVQGRYAYVTSNTTAALSIFDISNPSAIVPAGSTTTGLTGPWAVYVQGRYAYVANAGANNLAVYDVSNPSVAPVNVGTVGSNLSAPRGVYVSGRYAYVASNANNTLATFDMGGEYAQQFEAGGAELGTLQVDSNSMFAGDVSIQGGTTIGQSLNVNGATSINGQLYVSGNITTTAVSTTATSLGSTRSLFVQGKYVYVINQAGTGNLQILDASNPSSPVSVSSTAFATTTPRDVYVQGRYAYIVHNGTNALAIYDVSNPASPALTGSVATDSGPISVYVQGRYAYVVSTTTNTLQSYDVSNPANPVRLSSVFVAGGSAQRIFVQGRYGYVTESNGASSNLKVFDLSNPASLSTFVGSVGTGNSIGALYVQGRYAYVVNSGNNTLQIFDIKNPASIPAVVGTATLSGASARDVYVQGRYAYVTTDNTLESIDISNPASPVVVNNVTTGNSPRTVRVSGRYAYVGNFTDGTLQIFDLGGAYVQQLEAGGAELGTLQVDSNSMFAGDVNIQGGLTVGQSEQVQGALSVTPSADSNSAFLIGDKKGSTVVNVSAVANGNLLNDGSFEGTAVNPSWAAVGSSTLTTDTAQVKYGSRSLKVVASATNPSGTFYNYVFKPNTTYTLSFSAIANATMTNIFQANTIVNNTPTPCTNINNVTLNTGSWQQFTCTFTTGGTINPVTDGFNIEKTGATTPTWWVDGVQLEYGSAATNYADPGFILQNLVSNPSLEGGNTNGWYARGATGVTGPSASTDFAQFGNDSLKIATGTVAGNGVAYSTPLTANTQYSLSFWAKAASNSTATFNAGASYTASTTSTVGQATNTVTAAAAAFNANMVGDVITYTSGTSVGVSDVITGFTSTTVVSVAGSRTVTAGTSYEIDTDSDCLTNQTFTTTWQQFTCTFTTGASIGRAPSIYIRQTDTASDTAYIDGVTLTKSPTALAYSAPADSIDVNSYTNNITLNGGQSGDIQGWNLSSNRLPSLRQSNGVVTANGYMYAIGGFNTAPINSVNYAKLNADGSVGTWGSTTNLPTTISDMGVAYANGYVYVLHGYAPGGTSAVYYAKQNTDGTLGNWLTANSTGLAALYNNQAVVYNGYLYDIGGQTAAAAMVATVSYAKLNADGSVGAWQSANNLNAARAASSAVTANGYLYVINGNDSTPADNNTIQYAQFQSNGSLGAWTTISPTTGTALNESGAVSLNGYLYLMGGCTSAASCSTTGVNSVMYAKLNADGSVGAWQASSYSLPDKRFFFDNSVTSNGYIYIVGGSNGASSWTNTVYYTSTSRTQLFGSLDLVGLTGMTLADQSDFQNSGAGSITAGNIQAIGSLQVQGQGSFASNVSINGALNVASSAYIGISQPTSAIGTLSSAGANDLAIEGNYAYAPDFAGHVKVIDISNSSSPTLVSTLNLGTPTGSYRSESVYVQGKYLYVATWDAAFAGYLQIADISNPANPILLTTFSPYNIGSPDSIVVSGRYAYLTDGNPPNRLHIIDISNPTNPQEVFTSAANAYGLHLNSVYVQGRYAYVQSDNGISVLDISNPASPAVMTLKFGIGGTNLSTGDLPARSIFVQGRYIYTMIQAGADAFKVIDASNPSSLSIVGTLPLTVGSNPLSVYVQGNYAYLGNDSNSTITTIDISNPTNPVSVGTFTGPGSAVFNLIAKGKYLYVASFGSSKLGVYDLGGAYVQQLEAGGAELGTLAVDSNSMFGGDAQIQGGLSVAGSASFQSPVGVNLSADSNSAFLIGDKKGSSVVNVSAVAIGNLLADGNFEGTSVNTNVVTGLFSAADTLSSSTSAPVFGSRNLLDTTTATANRGIKFKYGLKPSTTYTFSIYANVASGAPTANLVIGRQDMIYNTGSAGTGGVSSTTVTGSGTTFNGGNVSVGDQIVFADGTTAIVTVVGGATSLTVDHAITEATGSDYEIEKAADTCTGLTPTTTMTRYSCTFTTSSGLSYSTGTASTSGSSTTVTGSGTSWNTANVAVNDQIVFNDGQRATITNVGGATTLTVSPAVNEAAGSTYGIYKSAPSANGGVYVRYTSATGAFNFNYDGAQLEYGSAATNYADPGNVLQNLVSNPSLENGNNNGWSAVNSGAVSLVDNATTQAQFGNYSLKLITTANALDGAKYTVPLSPNTLYTMSWWVKANSGTPVFTLGRQDISGTNQDCASTITLSTSWQQFTCTFTTGGTITNPSNIYIRNSTSAAINTIYVDGVTLTPGSAALAYTVPSDSIDVNSFTNNIALNAGNTGDIQPWKLNPTTSTSAASNIRNCSLNGYVYQIDDGPNDDYYRINADGSWTRMGNVPDPDVLLGSMRCVAINGYIYTLGGGGTNANAVYSTKPNPVDGSISSWTKLNSLPTASNLGRTGVTLTANGYLYMVGGDDGSNAQDTIYYAKANADGTLGAWTTSSITLSSTNGPGVESRLTGVVANNFMYVIGGDNGSSSKKTVVYIGLNKDGSLAGPNWSVGTPLPATRSAAGAVVSNGYIYVVGGGTNGSTLTGTSTVFFAKQNADGSIGAWSTSANPLPATRTQSSVITSNGYIYVSNGRDSTGTSMSTIYYTSTARTQIAGGLDLLGLNGQSLTADGDTSLGSQGGFLTAGNTQVVGTLQVQGQGSFAQGIGVGGNISVSGSSYFGASLPSSAIGSVTTGSAPQMVVAVGKYLYGVQSTANTLASYSIANPSSPVQLNTIGTNISAPKSLTVSGHYAYVANNTSTGSISIFDIANPSALVSVGTISTGASTAPKGIVVEGRYAYVTNFTANNVMVIDVSNPASPAIVSTTATGASCTGPQYPSLKGNYLFIACQSNGNIESMNVSNPLSPSIAATQTTSNKPEMVQVLGRYAYVISSNTGNALQVFDVSNPASIPAAVGSVSFSANDFPEALYVQGRYAYVSATNNNLLKIVDVSNPAAPVLVGGSVATGTAPEKLFVLGRYAYVPNSGTTSIQVFDLGGTYAQQLEAGGLETGTLSTYGISNFGADVNIQGGLNVGQEVQVTGNVGILSDGTGNSPLSIVNSTTGINLLDVKDLSTNFGSAVTAGSFIQRNSYFGEEFNSFRQSNCGLGVAALTDTHTLSRGDWGNAATAAVCNTANTSNNSGEISTSGVFGASAATNSCIYSNTASNTNGFERFASTAGATVGSTADCLEVLGGAQGAGTNNNIFNTGNLPVVQMKFRPSATGTNQRTFAGISNITTAKANPVVGDKGIYFSNCTAPTTPTCGTSWAGIVSDGATAPNSATSTNAVACPATDNQGTSPQTTNFMYGRIESTVAPATTVVNITFYIDYDVSNGINETKCGTVTAIGSSGGLNSTAMSMFLMDASATVSTSMNLDVDYFRVYQDDNVSSSSDTSSSDGSTDSNVATQEPTPITPDPDQPDPNVAGSFFNFLGATSEDTVINNNLFVHGTIYADKIKANEIEGLSVFTDQLASLQQKLAETTNTTDPNSTTTNNTIIQTATTTLNLSDGLTVGGDASFHGNVFFYKLVTFTEKTLFNNDVTFAAHIATDGAAPAYSLEAGAGDTIATASLDGNDSSGSINLTAGNNTTSGKIISVTFNKPFAKAPRVILSAGNDQTANAKYYVQSTATGFTIYVIDPLASGANLQFSYFVIQ